MTDSFNGVITTMLAPIDGNRLWLYKNGKRLSRGKALAQLRDDPALGGWLGGALANMGYDGMYWECAAIGPTTLHKDFECVALRADHFEDRMADPRAFADKFAKAKPKDQVVYFENLGGRSGLVAPLPRGDVGDYGHLASFLRHALPSQVSAFFAELSARALLRAQTEPVYMSTAGDGVAWLHGRLDDRPKYYHFKPYIADYRETTIAGKLRDFTGL